VTSTQQKRCTAEARGRSSAKEDRYYGNQPRFDSTLNELNQSVTGSDPTRRYKNLPRDVYFVEQDLLRAGAAAEHTIS